MALPNIMRRLFRSDGYGPLLKPEIIPFASDLASKAADVAASTKWVKDAVKVQVYVDSNVASSGDGFTAETAVKTIAEGFDIVSSLPSSGFSVGHLHIAGGTYNESISIIGKYVFEIGGNVILNGNLIISAHGILYLYGKNNQTYDFTVNNSSQAYSLQVTNEAKCSFYANLIINTSGSSHCSLCVDYNSDLEVGGTVTIAHSSASADVVQCFVYSNIIFHEAVTIHATTGTSCLAMWQYSNLVCYGVYDADDCDITGHGIYASTGCNLVFVNTFKVKGYLYSILLEVLCTLRAKLKSAAYIKNMGTGALLSAYASSCISLDIPSGQTLNIESYTKTSAVGLDAGTDSIIGIAGSGTLYFSGNFKNVSQVATFSRLYIVASLTVGVPQGKTITGARYSVYNNSQLYVDGKGTARIPGSSGGYVKPNELSFYG